MVSSARQHPNNLPIALSSFIGRQREISEVTQRLSLHRLLTLTGPGGCGKTRLALRVAMDLVAVHADGVWVAELAPLMNATLVPQTVAAVVGVREQPGRTLLETLTDHLRGHALLLVLDNCEHLVAACAHLAEALLNTCPNLRILATSREPLGVAGEATWIVPPLSLPEPQPWNSPSSGQETLLVYAQSEAVCLFTERAVAASPRFTMTPEDGMWIAEVCRRLDGIPLAIELAAARVLALSVRQIAERLHDRFHLLITGNRTAPPRHQTLIATLDWSYALLSDAEQTVLQQLATFADGCTLEAAEGICTGVETADVLDVLTHLIEKSLVVVDRSGDHIRYRLLETIRMYARDKLIASGEAEAVQARHLDYYLHWAEHAAKDDVDPEHWKRQFEAEHDNVRVALEWSEANHIARDKGLRLAAAYGYFWWSRGYLSEGRMRLSAVLARPGIGKGTAAHAWALYWAACLAFFQSDYPASRAHCDESLAVSLALGPPGRAGVANALKLLAEIATEEGDYVAASARFEAALTIWRDLKDSIGLAKTLLQHGWSVMRTGDYEQATSRMQESLLLFREAGNTGQIALNLSGLGEAAIRQGQYDRATHLLEESLAVSRALKNAWYVGTVLGSLGWVALRQRDFPRMRALLGESIAVRMDLNDRGGIAWCLEKLAAAIVAQAQATPRVSRLTGYQHAARLYGAAAALRAPLGSMIDLVDQPDYERSLMTLRAGLGKQAYEDAWDEGAAMPLRDIIHAALAEPTAPAVPGAGLSDQPSQDRFAGLTARERETVVLIAQGKSNREIAASMMVGVKTVETYITRILNKLGFASRVHIATWVGDTESARVVPRPEA